MRTALVLLACLLSAAAALTQQPPASRHYDTLCARCHGSDGNGGEMGPSIVARVLALGDADLAAVIRDGRPSKGMPASALGDPEMRELLAYVRTLGATRVPSAPSRVTLDTIDGRSIAGTPVNQSTSDLQIRSDDNRIHLLRRSGDRYRTVTSEVDWPTYHGQVSGNRYSTVNQINASNVARLAPAWMFTLDAPRLQVTPVVVGGIMYVTSANECYALDAGTGRQIWHYRRPRTKGLVGDAAGNINRGVAVAGDRVFMVTDHAHIIALDRFNGALLWDRAMADSREHYGATGAPLTIGTLVITGISGGDEGVRGFLAAFDQSTGTEAWRFWTVPKPGEPGSETWKGDDGEHGCATTWLTGTYDPSLNLLYWPTGNPCPDYDGDRRAGDNLYSDSILAIDPSTGTLKWHFQYTPHDLWDWDAQQPPVLVDAAWNGQPRRLLLHANRNGFFYVLDRVNGALLLARPFVKRLTWAREIGRDGRPVLNPNQQPSPEGTTVCPAVEGAANWFSTSFSPVTGLYYVQSLEKCTTYTKTPSPWVQGQSYYSGSTKNSRDQPPQKVLRAIDIRTGAITWELPQAGAANSWGGTLATAGGLVFVGEDGGAFMAVEASTGKPLWQFQANALWKASPMTYVFDGRQHVAVAAGSTILSFALVGER